MDQKDLWKRQADLQAEHENLRKQLRRINEEITYYKAKRIGSGNQLRDFMWQIRHREVTIASISERMDEINKSLKTMEILYET